MRCDHAWCGVFKGLQDFVAGAKKRIFLNEVTEKQRIRCHGGNDYMSCSKQGKEDNYDQYEFVISWVNIMRTQDPF